MNKLNKNSLWYHVWQKNIWRKILCIFVIVAIVVTAYGYGVSRWYMQKHRGEPLVIGTTFIPSQAESLGLDPKATLEAIFKDLGIKQVRLVSYWKEIENEPGKYDFSRLDWQFDQANKNDAKVSLAIGLRQPRWPECHEPEWLNIDPRKKETWRPQLYRYMEAVVERYKDNPALADYELENEFFIKTFGECKDFDRERLISEYKMVKKLDQKHPVIVSRSNNWIGLPVGQPKPDLYAVSVYKRVWDGTNTRRYLEYPLPPWWYGAEAGMQEILNGRTMIIHELQAEPWLPGGYQVTETPLSEQFKSMDANRLKMRIKYGRDTGMRTMYLWGSEWWYWLKEKKADPSVWNVVRDAVVQARIENKH